MPTSSVAIRPRLRPFRVDDRELCRRVQAEFREMPGLTLTLAQAARLFSIEPARCEHILKALVRAGDLSTDGRTWRRPCSL